MKTITSKELKEKLNNNPFSNLNQSVYEVLLDAIVTLALKPGDKINVSKLTEQLCVSRTPVEFAIDKLANEGFILAQKGKSPVIKDMSLKEMKDIFIVRSGLESRACGLAASLMSDAEYSELEKLLGQFKIAQETRDYTKMAVADAEFHKYIIMHSGNPFLIKAYQSVEPYAFRFRMLYSVYLVDTYKSMYEEHAVIVSTMKYSDPTQAGAAMRRHLQLILTATENQNIERTIPSISRLN